MVNTPVASESPDDKYFDVEHCYESFIMLALQVKHTGLELREKMIP